LECSSPIVSVGGLGDVDVWLTGEPGICRRERLDSGSVDATLVAAVADVRDSDTFGQDIADGREVLPLVRPSDGDVDVDDPRIGIVDLDAGRHDPAVVQNIEGKAPESHRSGFASNHVGSLDPLHLDVETEQFMLGPQNVRVAASWPQRVPPGGVAVAPVHAFRRREGGEVGVDQVHPALHFGQVYPRHTVVDVPVVVDLSVEAATVAGSPEGDPLERDPHPAQVVLERAQVVGRGDHEDRAQLPSPLHFRSQSWVEGAFADGQQHAVDVEGGHQGRWPPICLGPVANDCRGHGAGAPMGSGHLVTPVQRFGYE